MKYSELLAYRHRLNQLRRQLLQSGVPPTLPTHNFLMREIVTLDSRMMDIAKGDELPQDIVVEHYYATLQLCVTIQAGTKQDISPGFYELVFQMSNAVDRSMSDVHNLLLFAELLMVVLLACCHPELFVESDVIQEYVSLTTSATSSGMKAVVNRLASGLIKLASLAATNQALVPYKSIRVVSAKRERSLLIARVAPIFLSLQKQLRLSIQLTKALSSLVRLCSGAQVDNQSVMQGLQVLKCLLAAYSRNPNLPIDYSVRQHAAVIFQIIPLDVVPATKLVALEVYQQLLKLGVSNKNVSAEQMRVLIRLIRPTRNPDTELRYRIVSVIGTLVSDNQKNRRVAISAGVFEEIQSLLTAPTAIGSLLLSELITLVSQLMANDANDADRFFNTGGIHGLFERLKSSSYVANVRLRNKAINALKPLAYSSQAAKYLYLDFLANCLLPENSSTADHALAIIHEMIEGDTSCRRYLVSTTGFRQVLVKLNEMPYKQFRYSKYRDKIVGLVGDDWQNQMAFNALLDGITSNCRLGIPNVLHALVEVPAPEFHVLPEELQKNTEGTSLSSGFATLNGELWYIKGEPLGRQVLESASIAKQALINYKSNVLREVIANRFTAYMCGSNSVAPLMLTSSKPLMSAAKRASCGDGVLYNQVTPHCASRYIDGFGKFKWVGDVKRVPNFYLTDCKLSTEEFGELPVIGFGCLMACALMLDDTDWLNAKFENLGYVVVKLKGGGACASCVRLDHGAAMDLRARGKKALPIGEIACANTDRSCDLRIDEMPEPIKREFFETLARIASTPRWVLAKFFMQPGTQVLDAYLEGRGRVDLLDWFCQRVECYKHVYAHELAEYLGQPKAKTLKEGLGPLMFFATRPEMYLHELLGVGQVEDFAYKSVSSATS